MNSRCALPLLLVLAAFFQTAAQAAPATIEDCNASERWAQVLAPAAPIDAAAHWLDRRHLRWPGASGADSTYSLLHRAASTDQPTRVVLQRLDKAPSAPRFAFVAAGVDLQLPDAVQHELRTLLRGELTLVESGPRGDLRRSTAVQLAGALDDLYAAAERLSDLGSTPRRQQTRFVVWAPTATAVAVCLHTGPEAPARQLLAMRSDPRTGAWSAALPGNLSGHYYTYLVDVYVRGSGWVRNRVTDPYSLSLNADSRRTWIGDLNDRRL
ncbi:MAG TPA: DUF3372 domain-containing protein, partial [Rubrivivax sp.]|nr:DUF3372 domain-containing protein [Rubrivivax sp.]